VFTARYALSPYIKQMRFLFKGLIECRAACDLTKGTASVSYTLKCSFQTTFLHTEAALFDDAKSYSVTYTVAEHRIVYLFIKQND
jgi:hypothetical protein